MRWAQGLEGGGGRICGRRGANGECPGVCGQCTDRGGAQRMETARSLACSVRLRGSLGQMGQMVWSGCGSHCPVLVSWPVVAIFAARQRHDNSRKQQFRGKKAVAFLWRLSCSRRFLETKARRRQAHWAVSRHSHPLRPHRISQGMVQSVQSSPVATGRIPPAGRPRPDWPDSMRPRASVDPVDPPSSLVQKREAGRLWKQAPASGPPAPRHGIRQQQPTNPAAVIRTSPLPRVRGS